MTEKAKKLGNESINPVYNNMGQLIDNYLTKRELFAAMAIGGMAKQQLPDRFIEEAAKNAIKCADALLEELVKTEDL